MPSSHASEQPGAESKRYSGRLREHPSSYTCKELQAMAGVKTGLRDCAAGPKDLSHAAWNLPNLRFLHASLNPGNSLLPFL